MTPVSFDLCTAALLRLVGPTYGIIDEFGYHVAENRVSVPDLHATNLHLLGLNPRRLTYRFQGREYRLTDVSGNLLNEILS